MIGSRLGNWVIDKELGRGGMGSVYLAHELGETAEGETTAGTGRVAAVKVLSAKLALEVGFRQRFEREIEALRRLKHPNIVEFFEAGEAQGSCYYVMEYVKGAMIDDLLDEVERLPWEEVLPLAVQICAALKHAHDHGVIHRDLKPTNLILSSDGLVKLLDFGVAKVFANSPLTATNAVVGTADFMSPEQAAGKLVTRRSDLYSLGVVLYRMITGRTPYRAESVLDMMHKHQYGQFNAPSKYVPDLPHALDELICQLLEKDPQKRPPDAYVVGKELQSIGRRMARKDDVTTDLATKGATIAEGGRSSAEPAMGPATLMSRLVRKELEELNREGPIGRMLNRAWLLILLLALVITILAWGLWPKDPGAILEEAEALAAKANWRDAKAQLEKLARKHPDHPFQERVAALQQQIDENLAVQEARREANSVSGFKPPESEAERIYREAAQEYEAGRLDVAKQKWQRLVDAFSGVAAQRKWVVLAQDALEKCEAAQADFTAIDEAIRLAKAEPRAQAQKRLKALGELYVDRNDKLGEAARARIAMALRELDAAAVGK